MPQNKYLDPAEQYERARGEGGAAEKIEEVARLAENAVLSSQLAAALGGEGDFLVRVVEMTDAEKQVKLAEQVLINTPFLKKLMPEGVAEANQAAFLVAFAQKLESQKQSMQ